MIRLDQWFRSEPMEDLPGVGLGDLGDMEPDHHDGAVLDHPTANADAAHLRELENSLSNALRELEQARGEARLREMELTSNLGSAVVERLAADIENGFLALQSLIECAVVDVLMAFLPEQATRRATDDLLMLIREIVADRGDPVLALRIPRPLHSKLQVAVDDLGVAATLTESNSVELEFSGHRARFEELSRKWHATIEGSLS